MNSPTRDNMKPSYYQAKPFHGVRTVSALSSIIVASILVYFCIQLKSDNFKIPWTFLIVLAASVLTIISLVLTLCIHSCSRLNPIVNLILNIPLVLAWIVGMGLMGWNLYGTLAHGCTIDNWGNEDGTKVCQEYKLMFAFVVFGTISQIAMIVVDVRARMAQTRSGRYSKMMDSTSTVKLEPYNTTTATTANNSVHDVAYQDPTPQYRDEPGWKPGQRMNTMTSGRDDYGDIGGHGQREIRMNDYYQPYGQQSHQTSHHSSYADTSYGQQSHQTGYQPSYADSNHGHQQYTQRY